MNRKLAFQFVLFLALALFAAHRQGLLNNTSFSERHRTQARDLERRFDELERLRRHEAGMYAELDEAHNTLAEASTVYLPDPSDVYAWAARQIRFVARDLEIGDMTTSNGPRLRTRHDEADREFAVARCRVDFTGDLDQVLDFIRTAEQRNPYLMVSDLYIGPVKSGSDARQAYAAFDWPVWQDPEQWRRLQLSAE